jgi:hypothetical protein
LQNRNKNGEGKGSKISSDFMSRKALRIHIIFEGKRSITNKCTVDYFVLDTFMAHILLSNDSVTKCWVTCECESSKVKKGKVKANCKPALSQKFKNLLLCHVKNVSVKILVILSL